MRAYYGTFGSVVEYPRIEIEGSLSWHFGEHISADLRMVVVPSAVVAFDAGPRVGKHHDENFQRKRDTESNRPTYRGPASLPPPTLLLPPISGLRVFDRIERGALLHRFER